MPIPIICALILSPALLVEATIDPSIFPERAKQWDRIGLYSIKKEKNDILLLLYFHDTSSVAFKAMKENKPGVYIYPNSLSMHGVFRNESNKWIHQELFFQTRTSFGKVLKTDSSNVVVECRPYLIIRKFNGETFEDLEKRRLEVSRPFAVSISFVDGRLRAR
jgi:hypothetical protein